jgi:hypothetical protein
VVVALVMAVAPQAGAAVRSVARTTAEAAPAAVAALPRIVSRPDGLFEAATGARFVSRGANYTRLSKDAAGTVYHSTFEPGTYVPARVIGSLEQMRHDGYNTVRVFVDPGGGNGHGIGRGPGTYDKVFAPYMDNLAHFVKAAAERGIYTIPSLDIFPSNSYYWEMVGRENGGSTPNMFGRNLSYMDKGRVAAKAEYLANFATALAERIGAEQRTAILAYQSDNEVYFETNKAPFDRMAGTVTPVNGVTYDMADKTQRQQAADASLVEYTHRVKRRLAGADPDGLLAVGFFSFQSAQKPGADGFAIHCHGDETACPSAGGRYRYPARAGILSYWGAVDLLDLHMYANHGAPVLDLHAMGSRKDPYIIGEFGAHKKLFNNDITTAAYAMRDMQREMCGLGAQGYLYFTWNTTEPLASMESFFHLTESGGAINGQLAPIVRPDPCR